MFQKILAVKSETAGKRVWEETPKHKDYKVSPKADFQWQFQLVKNSISLTHPL